MRALFILFFFHVLCCPTPIKLTNYRFIEFGIQDKMEFKCHLKLCGIYFGTCELRKFTLDLSMKRVWINVRQIFKTQMKQYIRQTPQNFPSFCVDFQIWIQVSNRRKRLMLITPPNAEKELLIKTSHQVANCLSYSSIMWSLNFMKFTIIQLKTNSWGNDVPDEDLMVMSSLVVMVPSLLSLRKYSNQIKRSLLATMSCFVQC